MDLGSVFLILALTVLVGLFVSRPLLERQKAIPNVKTGSLDHDRSALLAEYDRILNTLSELDLDHTLGKIPEEEYPEQRASLMQMGAEVLRQLDAIEEKAADFDMNAQLEATIAARRADTSLSDSDDGFDDDGGGILTATYRSPVLDPDDELEVMLSNRRRARQEKSAGFCPQCGGPLQRSDRFCPKCGASSS